MKRAELSGYILHQRPFKDNSKICSLFTLEHGLVTGVIRKNLPVFGFCSLLATGQGSLKSFSKPELQPGLVASFESEALYCAFYLNELLINALPAEEAHPELFYAYQHTLKSLSSALSSFDQALLLREFELNLLKCIGYEVEFTTDSASQPICAKQQYFYRPELGLVAAEPTEAANLYLGSELLGMNSRPLEPALLAPFTRLMRTCIDHALDYKPLGSRKLLQSLRSL